MAIGAGQSKSIESPGYTRRRFEHFLWALLVLFVSLALGVGAVGFFYAKNERVARSDAAVKLLATRIRDISGRIAVWLELERSRALKAAGKLGAVATVEKSAETGVVAETERRLAQIESDGNFEWVALFDGDGRFVADGVTAPPDIREMPAEAVAALKQGDSGGIRMRVGDDSDRLMFEVWCPTEAAGGEEDRAGSAGSLVVGVDAQQHGFPSMVCEDVLGAGVEICLCDTGESEFRTWPAGVIQGTWPEMSKAVAESPEGFASFKSEEAGDSRSFIAVWRRIDGTGLFVVGAVAADRLEATLLHTSVIVGSIVSVFILSAVLAVLVLAWLRNTELLERRLASERERHSLAERFEQIMLAANDAIIIADSQGKIVEANIRARELYGAESHDLKGMKVEDIVAPETRAEWTKRLAACGEKPDGGILFETLHRRLDGAVFPVEVSVRQISPKVGDKCCLLIVRNLSERKKNEAELVRMNALYSALSRVHQGVVRSRTLDDLFRETVNALCEAGGFQDVWIAWADVERRPAIMVRAGGFLRAGDRKEDARRVCRLAAEVWARGKMAVRRGLEPDAEGVSCAIGNGRTMARSCCVFPLFVRGRLMGLLAVGSGEEAYFDEQKTEMVSLVASDIGIAAERIDAEMRLERSHEQLELSNSMLGVVCGINHLITHEKEAWVILERACAALTATPVFAAACILLVEKQGGGTRVSHVSGDAALVENFFARNKPEETEWVKRAIESPNVMEIPPDEIGRPCGVHGYAAPMRAAGRLYGILLGWLKSSLAGDDILSYFQTIAGDLAFAIYGAEIEESKRKAEEKAAQESEEIRQRNEELERFRRLALGRELRMIEIKRQVNELSRRLGEPLPYPGVLGESINKPDGSRDERADQSVGN